MPREMEFCGRCSHLLAPARRKHAQVGERLGVRTVDYGRVCLRCIERHGLTPVREDTPVAVPAPAPSPTVALAAAQAAMDALPEWIKRDGAAHGRARREAAANEATAKPGRKPAAPVKHYSVTPSIIAREDRDAPMDEAQEAPAPVARDIKETPKPVRPVRRPARPRREPSAAALAALAPASDTHDMAALDRMHGTQTSSPAPRPWVHEMPGPVATARPSAPVRQSVPAAAITAAEAERRRREFALAYAQKHGADMAPPSRRPIVTAEEIRTGMRSVPPAEDGVPDRFHPDVVLDRWEAGRYVRCSIRTLDRHTLEGRIPTVELAKGGRGYLVADLNDYRAGRPARPAPAPAPVTDTNSTTSTHKFSPAARKAANTLRHQQVIARIAMFAQLLTEGVEANEAAERAGYERLDSAKRACRQHGRRDVLAQIPDRRRTEERAA